MIFLLELFFVFIVFFKTIVSSSFPMRRLLSRVILIATISFITTITIISIITIISVIIAISVILLNRLSSLLKVLLGFAGYSLQLCSCFRGIRCFLFLLSYFVR